MDHHRRPVDHWDSLSRLLHNHAAGPHCGAVVLTPISMAIYFPAHFAGLAGWISLMVAGMGFSLRYSFIPLVRGINDPQVDPGGSCFIRFLSRCLSPKTSASLSMQAMIACSWLSAWDVEVPITAAAMVHFCQRSWSSISAMAALNLFLNLVIRLFVMLRASLSVNGNWRCVSLFEQYLLPFCYTLSPAEGCIVLSLDNRLQVLKSHPYAVLWIHIVFFSFDNKPLDSYLRCCCRNSR